MPNPVSGRIGLSEMPGIFGAPGCAIQSYDLDVGAVRANSIGMMAKNTSGLLYPAGTLVYQIGWDVASGFPLIGLATAASELKIAQWVTAQAIPNGGTGLLSQRYTLTGLNTGGAAQGDPVYLSTVAGGFNTSVPTASSVIYQTVGRVAVVSASVGVIQIDLLNSLTAPRFATNAGLPMIGTAAGAYPGYALAPYAGTIVSAFAVFPTALAISGTNYVTISATDGANPLLATASPANSTFTGGAAIVAGTKYPLTLSGTPANLVVAANDLLTALVTVTGTLGAALAAGGAVFFSIQPN